jgi:hypothetical protein
MKGEMKVFVRSFLVGVLLIFIINPVLYSKSAKSHPKKIAKRTNTKQTKLVKESLMKLKTYLIGYDKISVDFPFVTTNSKNNCQQNLFSNSYLREKLLENILLWLGTPYRMAGSSKKGIDCSNFVARVLEETLHINFPANAQTQTHYVKPIKNFEDLTFGDLIFFSGRNRKSQRIGHVGIYLGNGIFAHSSTSKGVIITHISEGYYTERFRFGGRVSLEPYFVMQ